MIFIYFHPFKKTFFSQPWVFTLWTHVAGSLFRERLKLNGELSIYRMEKLLPLKQYTFLMKIFMWNRLNLMADRIIKNISPMRILWWGDHCVL